MELHEIKTLLDEQGRAFEEFKKTNDQRLQALASGKSVTELEEKLGKINADLTRIETEAKQALADFEKRANRPRFEAEEKSVLELKAFNLALKAHAMRLNRSAAAEVSAEEYQEYKRAFNLWARRGRDALAIEEVKTLTIGSDPEGGFLVPAEVETALDRVLTKLSALRSIATVRTIGAASYKKPVVVAGAAHGGWAGETEGPSKTDTPRIEELEFTPGKSWAEPWATADMLEDAAFDAEGWLLDEVSLTMTEKEGDSFVNGDGVKKPRGFLDYDTVANASYAWGKIGFVVSGHASGFAATAPSDKLIDLQHALRRQYRVGAKWLMNDATLGEIRKFKDGQNNYLWKPGLEDGVSGQLLGYDVVTDDFMPDVAANKFPIAFGDFKRGYVIVDRRGTVVIRDHLTNKPYVKFYTTKRVGGGVQNFEAIKTMKIST